MIQPRANFNSLVEGLTFERSCWWQNEPHQALKMLGFLFRICKDFKNVNSLKIVFFAFVRSHLEYCSPVWNPTKVTYSTEIDRIQRKFVKFLYHKNLIPDILYSPHQPHTYSYSSCSEKLNIDSLSNRRHFFDIDLVLKTFTGRLNSSDFLQFFKFPPTTRTLRHLNAFQVPNNKCSAIDAWVPLMAWTLTWQLSTSCPIYEPKR
jgi:hypothetical protein